MVSLTTLSPDIVSSYPSSSYFPHHFEGSLSALQDGAHWPGISLPLCPVINQLELYQEPQVLGSLKWNEVVCQYRG